MSTFDQLGLSPKVLEAVARLGYAEATPVQQQAIPLVLEGRDLIAAAKTGTGKTAAFSLPALDSLNHAKGGNGPGMLVVTPTRELAQQIGEVCSTIAESTHHRIAVVVGGLSYEPQIKQLKNGVDVLIATPGRLVDLMEQGAARLGDVSLLVLDEADRMLDMGFLPSMKKIIGATPTNRQTLLFSATIDRSIMGSIGTLLRNPALVEIAHKGDTADTVEQFIVHAPQTLKPELLRAVLKEKGARRVIVFTRTRSRADATCRRLKRAGYTAEAIHSDRSQNQRRRALDNFSNGTTDILVATDVLARGIDVESVDHVINYDLPTQPEDYVHRIGRTGRAGEEGWAISFVSPETKDALRDIEKLIKRPLPQMEISSFNLEDAEAEAAAHATRKAARQDPDIAQAARELARRERRKEKAREATDESDSVASTTRPHSANNKASSPKKSRGPKKNPNTTSIPSNRTRTMQKSTPSTSSAQKSTSSSTGSQKPARSGSDLRPGRAHRAAIEQQRTKRR